ncbi:MAG: alanine dehydrogenase [Bacteroidetes bacterium]|nr:alanine dehydrogenase [Bacteroidota bacterium]MDA0874274.1 alanine dehydrogenase [Bacteroidota bacterium]
MEVPSLQGLGLETGVLTKEKQKEIAKRGQSLTIGVPKEASPDERRVAMAPAGVAMLVANGHNVLIGEGAGSGANFSDTEYADAGAEIVASASQLYSQASLIVKVGPPTAEEVALLQERQVLISALHLGNTSPDFLRKAIELGVTGLGFEFIRDSDGSLPIVRMMHEIMGSMAVQIAARYLESGEDGRGIMLGGISGVPPSNVVILGAGVIGEWAARTALGFGAHVIVLDNDLGALRSMEHYLGRGITTAMATPQYISQALLTADVVIGAMMSAGNRAPVVVTEDMVASMRDGSVIVDTMIDQGGCIETSQPTTHSDPIMRRHGVIHYAVPNMPSNAARTATYALTNVLVPYVLKIGDAASVNEALWMDVGLRNGTYVYRKHLTKKSLASMFGIPHRDIELLIASGI